jgi:beta-1,4-N-acetylglucosaminyltransferase
MWAPTAYLAASLLLTLLVWYARRTAASRAAIKTLVVFGSGGHTAEMCVMLKALNDMYAPLAYVAATTDTTSAASAVAQHAISPATVLQRIPRSREVGQSYLSAVISTARSVLASFALVARLRPQLVLCNGPGTCLPICAAAWILTIIGVCRTRVCFVESVCRVETMSVTGRILYYSRIADSILVQWPRLQIRLVEFWVLAHNALPPTTSSLMLLGADFLGQLMSAFLCDVSFLNDLGSPLRARVKSEGRIIEISRTKSTGCQPYVTAFI